MTSELTVFNSIHWKNASTKFMNFFKENDVLCKFVCKIFWVWDAICRLQSWRSILDKHHSIEATWHISVDFSLLNSSSDIALLLMAMHDLKILIFFPSSFFIWFVCLSNCRFFLLGFLMNLYLFISHVEHSYEWPILSINCIACKLLEVCLLQTSKIYCFLTNTQM